MPPLTRDQTLRLFGIDPDDPTVHTHDLDLATEEAKAERAEYWEWLSSLSMTLEANPGRPVTLTFSGPIRR